MHIINSRCALIWIVRHPVNDNHSSGVAFIGSLNGSAAHHKCFIHIHSGSQMSCASLKSAEFHGSGLAADLLIDHICQIACRAGELLVSECIHIICCSRHLTDILALCIADPLGDGDHDHILFLQQLPYLFHKLINLKRHLRQIN